MSGPVQRDEAWFAAATPEQLVQARDAGELADLLATAPTVAEPTATPPGQVFAGDLRLMNPAEVVEALEAGRLDHLLGKTPRP